VAAVDGTEVNQPQEVSGKVLRIGAGGRLDVVFRMPDAPVTLRMEAAPSAAVVIYPAGPQPSGSSGAGREEAAPAFPAGTFAKAAELDLLGYGLPDPHAPATEQATREEVLVLDRQFRFVDGVPQYAYTVNGAAYPNIPAVVVAQGDVVKLTLVNRSAEPHPMHPHGHHVRVLSRNGVAPTGSPLFLDTVDVLPGDVWEVLLTADNPGVWMDHCHNLEHAAQGMMALLQYEGIVSPFMHGGHAHNKPE
jgi:FtsP/CotA-like multicopper oxidase with cupredoxin domain